MPSCPFTADVDLAAQTLRDGGLVAFGTETVYGLGGNALDPMAVARIFEAKNRPHFDPLIVHIADSKWLPKLATDVSPLARKLIEAFWPGPLTLVLPKTDLVPDLVTSGLPAVAVRMPSHEMARELLARVDLPIAAPSANPFGQLSPTTAQHVAATLGERIDLILDGGPCGVGVESTVLQVTDAEPRILRHGGVTQEQIESVLGTAIAVGTVPASETAGSADDSETATPSPGMLPQHYAPRTPLALAQDVDLEQLQQSGRRLGALALSSLDTSLKFEAEEILSPDGDLTVAAARFFAALRQLDAADLDQIIAWPFPDEGLGRALNDRLRRARHG